MNVGREATGGGAGAGEAAFQAKLRERIKAQDAGDAHVTIHVAHETNTAVNQERRRHRQIIIQPCGMGGGGEIAILSERNGQAIRAVEMRAKILGVIKRYFAFAAQVFVNLDGWDNFVGVGKIGLVPVIQDSRPCSPWDERLDFQSHWIHSGERDHVARERFAYGLAVRDTVGARVVNRVFRNRPPSRVRAERLAGKRAAKIPVSHGVGRKGLEESGLILILVKFFVGEKKKVRL